MRRSIRQDDGSVALDEQVCERGRAQVAEAEQDHEPTRSAHKHTARDSQCKRDCDEPGNLHPSRRLVERKWCTPGWRFPDSTVTLPTLTRPLAVGAADFTDAAERFPDTVAGLCRRAPPLP